MADDTPLFALPLLAAGQAQKEVPHNEAILALECLAQPIVEAVGVVAPPATPAQGASWIVGAGASGAWAGRTGSLAHWTPGGWRFFAPIEGMAAYDRTTGEIVRYHGAVWESGRPRVQAVLVAGDQVLGPRQPAIAAPSGGGIVDAEARSVLSALLTTLRRHGLIAT